MWVPNNTLTKILYTHADHGVLIDTESGRGLSLLGIRRSSSRRDRAAPRPVFLGDQLMHLQWLWGSWVLC